MPTNTGSTKAILKYIESRARESLIFDVAGGNYVAIYWGSDSICVVEVVRDMVVVTPNYPASVLNIRQTSFLIADPDLFDKVFELIQLCCREYFPTKDIQR